MRYTWCGTEVWSWSYQSQGQRKASCLLLKTPVSTSFLNSKGDSVSQSSNVLICRQQYVHTCESSPLLFSHTPNQSSIYSLACISRSFSIFLQLTISLPWIIYTSPSQPSLFDPSPLVRNNFAYSSANSCSLPKSSVLCALFFTLCPVDTAVQHARWTPLRSIIDSLTTYLSCYCFWNSGFQSYRPWAYLAPIPQFRVQRSYFRSSQLIIRPQSYVNLNSCGLKSS